MSKSFKIYDFVNIMRKLSTDDESSESLKLLINYKSTLLIDIMNLKISFSEEIFEDTRVFTYYKSFTNKKL